MFLRFLVFEGLVSLCFLVLRSFPNESLVLLFFLVGGVVLTSLWLVHVILAQGPC